MATENLSIISRMVAPPRPMTSRILFTGIENCTTLGALDEISARGASSFAFIASRMCRRPLRACSKAAVKISSVMPLILISICSAVIPSLVPATLKSMSPKASSSPRISLSTTNCLSSLIRPMAIPATADLMGTPASISAKLLPQTVAIELEPLQDRISDTTRVT